MARKAFTLPDFEHQGEPYPWGRHRPAYADRCPLCVASRARNRRITSLHAAFVEFGYTTLTRDETATAYDKAVAGDVQDGDIIAMLIRSQLNEAAEALG